MTISVDDCPFTRTVSVTVKYTLADRMGSRPILSIKRYVTITTMIKFDEDEDERRYV